MKYVALLMLLASLVLADSDNAGFPTTEDAGLPTTDEQIETDQNDLILIMLQQIKDDVADLSAKTDSLQVTTDSLESSVRNLNLKVRSIEDDVAEFSEFQSTVEANFTAIMDINQDALQQITDLSAKQQSDYSELSSDISALETTAQDNHQDIIDLSSKQQSDYNRLDSAITVQENAAQDNNQDISDLTNKEQSDFNKLTSDLSELDNTVQDNYRELRADVDEASRSAACSVFNNGYTYEWVETTMSWLDARTNCIIQGGDMAYHGFDDMAFREKVICAHLKQCSNGADELPWIGLTKLYSSNEWRYLDGTASPYDSTVWYSSSDYTEAGEDCALLNDTEYGYSHFMEATSLGCTFTHRSICEFPC